MTEKAYFEYQGIKSSDMYLRIENNISFPSPEADVEFIEVMGKDGDLAIDHKRLKGENFPIPVQLRLPEGLTVNEQATEISNWLKNNIGWFPLKFSGQPDYHYIAMINQRFDIAETLKNFGKTVITFRIKPYKMKNDNGKIVVTNGQTITNEHKRPAKPIIEIDGTGNVTLKNNGVDWLILTSVDGNITIDSEPMSIHKNGLQQFQKMNSNIKPLFPLLNPGENKITWTGTVTSVKISPRWEAII